MNTMLRAIEVYDVIQAEREWLTLAARSYPTSTYERLMQYSANRLQMLFNDRFNLGHQNVQIVAEMVYGQGVHVQVLVMWTGDMGKAMQRAHLRLCNPIARA